MCCKLGVNNHQASCPPAWKIWRHFNIDVSHILQAESKCTEEKNNVSLLWEPASVWRFSDDCCRCWQTSWAAGKVLTSLQTMTLYPRHPDKKSSTHEKKTLITKQTTANNHWKIYLLVGCYWSITAYLSFLVSAKTLSDVNWYENFFGQNIMQMANNNGHKSLLLNSKTVCLTFVGSVKYRLRIFQTTDIRLRIQYQLGFNI